MPSEPVSQSHLTELLVPGTRVVLRCRLASSQVEPGGPTLTDVVGDVAEVTADAVVLGTRNGAVPVDRSSIVLAKRIPPARPRRAPRSHPLLQPTRSRMTASSPSDGPHSPSLGEEAVARDLLEALMVAGMPPLDSAHVGDWLLRAANGYTGRANSVLAVGDPGVPLDAAVEQVVAWYAERDQPALIQLPHATDADPAASTLGSVLAQQDWHFFLRTSVMTRRTPNSESAANGALSAALRVEVSDEPTDDWWRTASPRALAHRDTLGRMLERVRPAAYLTAYLDDRPIGHLRLALADGWSGVFDVHTDPAARGRGVARALMRQAERTASERRIPLQYLQVAADNHAAVGLYRSLGWQTHHEYHYARPTDH